MQKLSEIFNVQYGHSLELNSLKQSPDAIPFISRTSQNNGVSARVCKIPGYDVLPAGTMTVALGGSVLETFLQIEPYYTGYHIFSLSPKTTLSNQEKLYYCACIRANKYRYNYGRQANRTLRDILLPSPNEIPNWVNNANPSCFDGSLEPKNNSPLPLRPVEDWNHFILSKLFDVKKGKRLTKANMTIGNVPFIGSIDGNNGLSHFVGASPIHKGNTITVNYNGSVAEAFYQDKPFWACDDVNVLYPKFNMTPAIALFIVAIIRQEKYRFNYGRKWHLERMEQSTIKLPVNKKREPDLDYMENFINTLPFSSVINKTG